MVVPNNHGFPTKNDHFGVFWGYHHLRNPQNISRLISPCFLGGSKCLMWKSGMVGLDPGNNASPSGHHWEVV